MARKRKGRYSKDVTSSCPDGIGKKVVSMILRSPGIRIILPARRYPIIYPKK